MVCWLAISAAVLAWVVICRSRDIHVELKWRHAERGITCAGGAARGGDAWLPVPSDCSKSPKRRACSGAAVCGVCGPFTACANSLCLAHLPRCHICMGCTLSKYLPSHCTSHCFWSVATCRVAYTGMGKREHLSWPRLLLLEKPPPGSYDALHLPYLLFWKTALHLLHAESRT